MGAHLHPVDLCHDDGLGEAKPRPSMYFHDGQHGDDKSTCNEQKQHDKPKKKKSRACFLLRPWWGDTGKQSEKFRQVNQPFHLYFKSFPELAQSLSAISQYRSTASLNCFFSTYSPSVCAT
jgi:hypothetical protein